MPRKLSTQQIDEFRNQVDIVRNLIAKAQYKKAFVKTENFYKTDPKNPLKKMRFAILLGGQQEGLTESEIRKNKVKASKILKEIIMRDLQIIPEEFKNNLLNEFFWFSEQPKKQYELGIKSVKAGNKKAYYSQGVGATMLAINLLKIGKNSESKRWAKIAGAAWKNYFKIRPDYYNAFCFYAISLGALGEFDGMEEAFKKAARLSGRHQTYSEFCEFRVLLWKAHLQNSKLKEK